MIRKKTLTLKEAKPAIRNLIKSMKSKYQGRNVQFENVSQVADDIIDKNMPSRAKKYLSETPHVRMVGHENGIEFYYYKLKTDNGNLFILPIIVMSIQRNNNEGQPDSRLLVCSLDTFLPKLVSESYIEVEELIDSI